MQQVNSLVNDAIDVHCHGVGRFDFTETAGLHFLEIENILASRHHHSILTLYLPENNFDDFLNGMQSFSVGKEAGLYPHISGISLEGPLLASHGGTPKIGVWSPSKEQWQRLSECGKLGLLYVIFSPDAPAADITWITETLLQGGVLPAAGHFSKENPLNSAKKLQSIYDVVASFGECPTITDHLYNDMPHNFKHAWRLQDGKQRAAELEALHLESWTLDNMDEKLGPVPATMIRNALKGIVKIALNFDGEHVDLAVCKKTVELVGAENMLMMTDSIESKKLAGRQLHMQSGSTLLYQDEGVVAAGSQGVAHQIKNMENIGLSHDEIKMIVSLNPRYLLSKRQQYVYAEK